MKHIKAFIRKRLPFLVYPLRVLQYFFIYGSIHDPEKVFARRYKRMKGLGGEETRSGPGSDLAQTEVVRKILPELIKELDCKSLLDIPCGDFFWMKLVPLSIDYIGADIEGSLIEENRKLHAAPNRTFLRLDIVKDPLPKTDLVLCRDCLFYLSNEDVFRSLKNMKASGATYLLMTTFPEKTKNENIPTGSWRAINFELPPFGLPRPTRVFNEKCPVEGFEDKSLGLWKMTHIPGF